jgi:hypothetical protein
LEKAVLKQEGVFAKRLLIAANAALKEFRKVLNVPNRPKYWSSGKPYYPNPSRPGEPPRRRTGNLRNKLEVRSVPEGAEILIPAEIGYGPLLDKGTTNIQPRPWIFVTITKMIDQLRKICGVK